MQRVVSGAVLLLGLASSAMAAQCDANFVSQGSFLTGRQMQTHARFQGAPEAVYQAIYGQVLQYHWTITQADPAMGTLSAFRLSGQTG